MYTPLASLWHKSYEGQALCMHMYAFTGDSAVAVTEQGESIVHQSGGGGEGGREGGGEGEGVVFRVTRHTPRRVRGGERGGHRRVLTPEASLHSAGKRMKLDQTPFVLPRNKGSILFLYRHTPSCMKYCVLAEGV